MSRKGKYKKSMVLTATMIRVALLRPENPANIGAIARVMKNFGYSILLLIDPQCNHLSQEARNLAKHAQDVLEQAKILHSLHELDGTIVGTTAQVGTDYNLPRTPLLPKELKEYSGLILLFGPEGTGLTNREIAHCDLIVKIPTNSTYPTLNVSHAVAILLYELQEYVPRERATKQERKELYKNIKKTLNAWKFSTKEKKQTQEVLWQRILYKMPLTTREVFGLHGYFKKVLQTNQTKTSKVAKGTAKGLSKSKTSKQNSKNQIFSKK